MLVCKS